MAVLASIATVMEPISPFGEPNSVASYTRYTNSNTIIIILFCFCLYLSDQVEAGAGLSTDLSQSRPADILVQEGSRNSQLPLTSVLSHH